jgi:hypothetical protein
MNRIFLYFLNPETPEKKLKIHAYRRSRGAGKGVALVLTPTEVLTPAPKEALFVFSRPYLKIRLKVKGLRLKVLDDLSWIPNPLRLAPDALCPHSYIGLPPRDTIDMVLRK